MTTATQPTSTLFLPQVQSVLQRLHAQADSNDKAIVHKVLSSGYNWKSASAQANATMFGEALLPIAPDVGHFLYNLARSINAKRIVEFGTSFGVSTIYLAAALRDNGGGLAIGSELESSKVTKAVENLTQAELLPFVEIRAGDALQTLANLDGAIDLLFLDGWNDLYLDVLLLLLDKLRSRSVVLADDLKLFPEELAPYLDYVRNPANGFISVTLPIDDGIEYSVKL
jgi:predicted O-methyltransferase YrrM